MQLLHSIYDLQESLEWKEFERALDLANDWTNKAITAGGVDVTVGTAADKEFASKFNALLTFWDFQEYTPPTLEGTRKKQRWNRCPACVLTRWGYVGKASSFGWKHFQMLLKLTQIIINKYDSNSRPNKIASGLQSLLLERQIFVDLALMKCFHEGYFDQHLSWMMSSTDLTNHPSFQAHQIAVRYFIMNEDLTNINEAIHTDHPSFLDYRQSLNLLEGEDLERKKTNAHLFIELAIEMLVKHFQRSCTKILLPAALMTEAPLARCVARAIDTPSRPNKEAARNLPTHEFFSSVHKRWIDLTAFEDFICHQVDSDIEEEETSINNDSAVAAAKALLGGLDFRCVHLDRWEATVEQKWLWWRFLPLASQTQFVEAGVKECNLVSQTGREEEMRSSYAIVRSSLFQTMGSIKRMSTVERIEKTIEAIHQHVARQDESSKNPSYKKNLKMTREETHENHFKHERLGKKRATLEETADTNKKANKRQKTTGTDNTASGEGKIAYTNIFAKHKTNQQAIKTELSFRGVEDDALKKTFTELKKVLKAKELERVKDTDEYKAADKTKKDKMEASAVKAFKVLSEAEFVVGKD